MPACSLDSVVDPICGNGVLDDDEICDAEILGYEASCPAGTHLPQGASLICNADCSLNTSACVPDETPHHCGNGALDSGEICDADKLSYDASCPEGKRLPSGASLSCNADCTLNTDACVQAEAETLCGNGVLDDGEICDAEKVSYDASCPKGTHLPQDVRLSCNEDCSINASACIPDDPCGNGTLDDGEICDGSLIQETASCPDGTHLADGKAFSCKDDCTLDISVCAKGMPVDKFDPKLPNGLVAHDGMTSVPIRRTPQTHFPDDTLEKVHNGEDPQIVGYLDVGIRVNLLGVVGEDSYSGPSYRIQYGDGEYYIHSSDILVSNIPVPKIEYSSAPTPNYSKNDARWKDEKYRTTTFGEHGSGPVTLANVISILKDDETITPVTIAEKLNLYQSADGGPGTNRNIICPMIEVEYQFECEMMDTTKGLNYGTDASTTENDAATRKTVKQKLAEAFKNGWYVAAVVGGAPNYWSDDNSTYYITIYGYDKDNDILYVDDPLNAHYMQHGIDDFLNYTQRIHVITNKKPKTAKGIITGDKVYYRRSPQNKFSSNCSYRNDLLNTDHTSGLAYTTKEYAQVVGKIPKGTLVELLGTVKNTSLTSEWYQVLYKSGKYYVLKNSIKTNGIEPETLTDIAGATLNYYQAEPKWGNTVYATGHMSDQGGGPACMADVLSVLLEDKSITPLTIAREFKESGAENTVDRGTHSDERMCNIPSIKNNKINCDISNDNSKDKIIQTIREGGYVISLQNPGYWTDGKRYIVIYGYDGKYFFADDPLMKKYRQKADDLVKTQAVAIHVNKKK